MPDLRQGAGATGRARHTEAGHDGEGQGVQGQVAEPKEREREMNIDWDGIVEGAESQEDPGQSGGVWDDSQFPAFTREVLWTLEHQAIYWRDNTPNPKWQSAYQEFIDAIDRLDATIARSSVRTIEPETEQ